MASSDFKATAAVAIDGWVREREAVLRERRAAARMRCAVMHELDLSEPCDKPCASCVDRAAEVHPLPKISRPRVELFPSWSGDSQHPGDLTEYRVVNGKLVRGPHAVVVDTYAWAPFVRTAEDAKRLFKLFAEPTEEVDDDGSAGGAGDVQRRRPVGPPNLVVREGEQPRREGSAGGSL